MRGNREGSFVRWDKKRTHNVNDHQVLEKAKKISDKNDSDVLLILNHLLSTDFTKEYPVKKLVGFTGSTIGDEGFHLYRYQIRSSK